MEKGWRKMAVDTALLTGSALVMRGIGMAFQIWLASRIGSTGIGLYQLVGSVNLLCAVFAIAGVRYTATRLISQELGAGNLTGADQAMARCALWALFFGVTAMTALRLYAEPIGFLWVGDARTVKSLGIIAFRLPFIALSSVLGGYFLAVGRAWKSAAVQVAEQLFSISLTAFFLSRTPGSDVELSCAAVCRGMTLGDIFSFGLALPVWFFDRRHEGRGGKPVRGMTARMVRTAAPLAVSALARTSLGTAQQLLVPRELRLSGLEAEAALGTYGMITGMVFPVLTFPTCLLGAVAELTVPELTAAQAQGDRGRIRRTVYSLLSLSLLFALSAAGLLFACAGPLCRLVYHSGEAAAYLRLFSLLAVPMYLDIVTDGCLKGLGKMMNSMVYNLSEAALGLGLVLILIPPLGLRGYILVIFSCELFNFALSFRRLWKTVRREI